MLTEASGSSCFLFLRSFHLQTQSQYLIRFDGKGNGMIRHLQFSFSAAPLRLLLSHSGSVPPGPYHRFSRFLYEDKGNT